MNLSIEQAAQIQLALRARLKEEGLIKLEIDTINGLLDNMKHGELILLDDKRES